ncbi:helix-turn-helix transcriptional regulator [Actinoplanes sp. NPDC049681]|uniref:helix-turn-helix transcriptional regulator n=1 Tax=Actinoplanes sp. NPDC049681 TaxID=3363905 RepID=UPI0037B63E85
MQDRWSALAALADPSRRALYDYVHRQDHAVSREEAADAQRMSRSLAAFHLDKLVDAGLLSARYEAPPGQPRGRGRAPKVYEPAGDGLAITMPERRYELIAEILADAVAEDPAHAEQAAHRHARHHGETIGAKLSTDGIDWVSALTALGFEPQPDPTGLMLLHNCPFHALAARHTALVCGLNHSLLGGLIDGLGATEVQARLAPRVGACCVELAAVPSTHPE